MAAHRSTHAYAHNPYLQPIELVGDNDWNIMESIRQEEDEALSISLAHQFAMEHLEAERQLQARLAEERASLELARQLEAEERVQRQRQARLAEERASLELARQLEAEERVQHQRWLQEQESLRLARELQEQERAEIERRRKMEEQISLELALQICKREREEEEQVRQLQEEQENLSLAFIAQLENAEREEQQQIQISEQFARNLLEQWEKEDAEARAAILENGAPKTSDGECYVCIDAASTDTNPLLLLGCKHHIHLECATMQIQAKKIGPGRPIHVSSAQCGLCREWLQHPSLDALVAPYKNLFERVTQMARQRIAVEDGEDALRRIQPGSEAQLLSKFIYYTCFKCNNPYYGGRAECGGGEAEAEAAAVPVEHYVCPLCSNAAATHAASCAKHGTEYVQFKCRWCCRPASFFCFGTTHFCDECHRNPSNPGVKPCPGLPQCHGAHPPNDGKTEFCMGCALCRHVDLV